jgi:hypothetical protein
MNRQLITATEVTKEPVRWLWPGRIPVGANTLFDGDPGSGKTSITYDHIGRVTTGRPMPECTEAMLAAGVVLLQAEDNLKGTVVPNLLAAGADLSRVKVFDKDRFSEQPLILPDDLGIIKAAATEVSAKLVVIDPLTAFVETNVNGDVAIRRVLGPLATLAEQMDLAVLIVRHLRKAGARNPLYAGGGSIGIIAAVRSALIVGPDLSSDDKHQHILALNKSNLADAPSLAYRTVKHTDDTITVEWLGPSKYSSADITAAQMKGDEHSALREAMQVLYSILSRGPVAANEVVKLARLAAISERTLKRAKRDLRVRSWKQGSGQGSRWYWQLPNDPDLLWPFDMDDLMDRLIYGDGESPLPGDDRTHDDNTNHQDDDHPGDDDGEENWSAC